MKDAIIGILLTAALIALFSAYAPILPTRTAYGVYPTEPGEGEITLPGGGEAAAEMMVENGRHESVKQDTAQTAEENFDTEQGESNQEKERGKNMNEIMIAFWHGVAAVVIGEACALALALILAAAWLRRK